MVPLWSAHGCHGLQYACGGGSEARLHAERHPGPSFRKELDVLQTLLGETEVDYQIITDCFLSNCLEFTFNYLYPNIPLPCFTKRIFSLMRNLL